LGEVNAMIISDDFKRIIDEDIEKCKMALANNNKAEIKDVYNTLVSKYGSIIDGFTDNLLSLNYDTEGTNRKKNVDTICQKLELFKAMQYENRYSSNCSSNNTVTVNNTNNMEFDISVSFSTVKEKIENMSALREDEITEILGKIEELEKIINSSERKTQKWANAKEIVKWIADKSVDVGLTLLPLILKLGQ